MPGLAKARGPREMHRLPAPKRGPASWSKSPCVGKGYEEREITVPKRDMRLGPNLGTGNDVI